ncbi:MAG: hypothetical protein V4656_01985 [Pseudomonadota bacterium]
MVIVQPLSSRVCVIVRPSPSEDWVAEDEALWPPGPDLDEAETLLVANAPEAWLSARADPPWPFKAGSRAGVTVVDPSA